MKKTIFSAFLALGVIAVLTSCGGAGWTDNTKAATKTACGLMVMEYNEADATAICDCYVNKLVEKYPDGKIAENDNTIDDCKQGYKTTAEIKAEEEQKAMMENDTNATETPATPQ